MITITDTQMQSLNEQLYVNFVQTIYYEYNQRMLPGMHPREDLKGVIYRQGKRAQQYGLATERHIGDFIVLSLTYRILLNDTYPETLETILRWPDRLPEIKLQLLQNELI